MRFRLFCSYYCSIKKKKLKKSRPTKVLRKMLVIFMSLAFFYLVIGDLIIFHQKAIFNFDAFAGHPLSKPDKSDKGSLYKLKDKKDRVLVKFLTFVSEHFDISIEVTSYIYVVLDVDYVQDPIIDQLAFQISFRGPPSR